MSGQRFYGQMSANGQHSEKSAPRSSQRDRQPKVLITGGAGFIGSNVAASLMASGQRVIVYDSLARPGVEENLHWLQSNYSDQLEVELHDVRDAAELTRCIQHVDAVYHFAAQVAVTTSLLDPTFDFDVNVHGTVNVLEACRQRSTPPRLLFTSTNKVYGSLADVPLRRTAGRYQPQQSTILQYGISESRPLEFHSPYGCSKGAADQYVLDYARCYGVPTVVFRMSCIYGPRQCGTEDQGWVAHFVRATLRDEELVFYGDGCQVRDLLYVDDLVVAMRRAMQQIDQTAGRAFNVGGGPANTLSLRELVTILTELHGAAPRVRTAPWREGDQRYYVSDTRAIQRLLNWSPQVAPPAGLARLYQWLQNNLPSVAAAN